MTSTPVPPAPHRVTSGGTDAQHAELLTAAQTATRLVTALSDEAARTGRCEEPRAPFAALQNATWAALNILAHLTRTAPPAPAFQPPNTVPAHLMPTPEEQRLLGAFS